ncbi:hypothetical protein AU188_23465 [Mycobacterium sp. IS-3022]|nr:hypothetical protein AU188_23465 [Mycobacterium sp. IS-3022]
MVTDPMLTHCETTMRVVCAELDVELVECNGEADHVHLLVAYSPHTGDRHTGPATQGPPRYADDDMVAANPVRRELTAPAPAHRTRAHLRSPSYFVISCGAAPLSITKQYTDRQARPL